MKKMKKIISLMLALACALTCAFALASCGDEDDGDTGSSSAPVANYLADAKAFIDAYAATAANSIVTTVKVEINGTVLEAAFVYEKAADGTQTINYRYDRIPTLEDADTEKVGTVVRDAQGNVTGDASVLATFGASGVAIDMDSDKIKNDKFSVSGSVLSINVAQADTQAVFGQAFASDAVSVITISGGKVTSITLNYTAQDNSVVEIVSIYNPAA